MKYQSFTIRFIKYLIRQWYEDVTPSGRYIIYALFLSAFGMVSINIPAYQIFNGLLALLMIVGFFGVLYRPRVTMRGTLPERTSVGEVVSIDIEVENKSIWPIYELHLRFFRLPSGVIQTNTLQEHAYLAGRDKLTAQVVLETVRRGSYELSSLRAYSTFPFNLGRFGKSLQPFGGYLVLPSFHPLVDIDLPVGSRYQPGGIALTSNVGESPEYIGNREYIPGEPARRIDFRSWARTGKPVVREFQEEYYCRIALFVDTYIEPHRKDRAEGFEELEAAISMTAAIADALSNGEYIIDLFAAGSELYVFRSGRHTAHFDNVLEILACVEPCRVDPFEAITPAIEEELGSVSTAVCILLDWDESRRQLVRTIQDAGCDVKVVLVSEKENPLASTELDTVEVIHLQPQHIFAGEVESL